MYVVVSYCLSYATDSHAIWKWCDVILICSVCVGSQTV